MPLIFEDVARLPIPEDNVAIATQRLSRGTEILFGDLVLTLSYTVLVGHRFAIRDIALDEHLLSWGQTFGIAIRKIKAGEYVINANVIKELHRRSLEIELPETANFKNDLTHYEFNAAKFVPADALMRYSALRTFMGYKREAGRGVGTRNTIVLLGTNSIVSGFVQKLESQFQTYLETFSNIDAIVAVTHTEGGHGKPNNEDLLLRTLAGFIVHPNVAAVLIVDYGYEAINNRLLLEYLQDNDYPLDSVLHHFMSLSASFDDDLAQAKSIVSTWLEAVNAMSRTAQPLSELKIALQCGGSDAFSGISGNPLAAWVAKEVIQYGGSANLAETDELIGAETYVLDKVRDVSTAQKFLSFVERFKERVAWHGHSAEGNPSGGNKFRGLYNIYLKSLGAAMKRHPDVRLDYVIDYAEPMQNSGYYFMDSPGNDLESIAGQVASGCNMIFFVTGNGSITNFPFVPTIKIVTTSERYQLLENDMDINAGRYLDGTPMPELGTETLDYTIDIASGTLSVGEKAGHSQVQIWRDWQLTQAVEIGALQNIEYSGRAIAINRETQSPDITIEMLLDDETIAGDRIGLILPTSLCSGQIARLCAEALNRHPMLEQSSISRFVTLTHTEGCGGSVNLEFRNTLVGYLGHPFVKHALLLEHGCEITHNDYFRLAMQEKGYHLENYGWASIQLDGGIQAVTQKMIAWFEEQIRHETATRSISVGLDALRIALLTDGEDTDFALLAELTAIIVNAGGTIILSEQDPLLHTDYLSQLGITTDIAPDIAYTGTPLESGLHLMTMPTRDWGETLTGLGTQVDLILSVAQQPLPGHPMIPMLQMSNKEHSQTDIVIMNSSAKTILGRIAATLSRKYTPRVVESGNVNFQVTRGLLGVSL